MSLMTITILLLIGFVSGVASGLLGIGGGVLIVPGLVYLARFSQHAAIGTSLAILLLPVGLAAVFEFYRQGNVDFKAALIVAASLFMGAWFGAIIANHVSGHVLRLIFGVLLTALGFYMIFDAIRRLF